MIIKPILHRILVKPDTLESKDKVFAAARAAGIAFEFSNERQREQMAIDTGEVLDFGPTVFKDFGSENPLQIGDKVVFARYGGKTIEDPETNIKYVLLNDEDVIALLK